MNIEKNNMSSGITLRQLEYLVALAETGQVSRAALRCHVSQSSMTIALKNLERSLGAQLFERHAKGVNLTGAGERFMRKAQGIVAGVEEAVEEIRHSPDDLSGRVRIGVTETISAYLIPMLVSALSRHFPNLQIEMIERDRSSIEKGLMAQEFDLAFILVSNMEGRAELEYETMLRSPRRLWLHSDSPLQYPQSLGLEDIARADYILLDMDEHVSTVNRYWGAQGLEPKVHFKSSSLEAVRSLVALGQGVTILSDLVYRPISLDGRRIIRRDLDDKLPTMDVGCVWKKLEHQPRNISAVIDFIRRSISENG